MSAAITPIRFDPHRFRTAAAHYLAGRVPYPPRLIARVAEVTGLDAAHRVIDLGCGPGQLARAFAPGVAEVVAIDPEPAMLAIAEQDAPANIRFVRGSSYDLGPQFGPCRLVVMGRSFHWMDRVDTLRRLDTIVDPGGAVVLFGDSFLDLPENAWRADLRAIIAPYREGKPNWRGADWVRHESVLLGSAFTELEQVAVIERRTLSAALLADRVLSMSGTSRTALGDAADDLAAEVTALVHRLAPEDALAEVVTTYALIARRE